MKTRRTQTARKTGILATAMLIGLLSSAAVAEPWTDEETASGVKKMDFVRYAFAGKEMNLGFVVALHPDCSVDDGWSNEIIKAPDHGVADIIPRNGFTSYAKDNPLFKCNERRINGQMLMYRPDDGYKGPDSFTLLTILPSGYAIERTYHFNVRAITKPKSAQRS